MLKKFFSSTFIKAFFNKISESNVSISKTSDKGVYMICFTIDVNKDIYDRFRNVLPKALEYVNKVEKLRKNN